MLERQFILQRQKILKSCLETKKQDADKREFSGLALM